MLFGRRRLHEGWVVQCDRRHALLRLELLLTDSLLTAHLLLVEHQSRQRRVAATSAPSDAAVPAADLATHVQTLMVTRDVTPFSLATRAICARLVIDMRELHVGVAAPGVLQSLMQLEVVVVGD